jgi:hypothetical protein
MLRLATLLLLSLLLMPALASGQTASSESAASGVQATSFHTAISDSASTAPGASAEPLAPVASADGVLPDGRSPRVKFTQCRVAVGDRVEQQFGVRLVLQTRIVQSGQVAHESTNDLGREQTRIVEVLEVADDKLRTARVTFPSSRNQTPDNPQPDQLLPQPVHGKSYVVTLADDQLRILDAQGAIPPRDEYDFVADALQNLGKPHPLSEYLLKHRLSLGERVLLPRKIAEELLGLGNELGEVKKFELQLLRVEPGPTSESSPRAVFSAHVETFANDRSPLEMAIVGQVVVETQTCRSLAADFRGPVQLRSVERTSQGIYQLSASGEVEVVIRSEYSPPR